ncbi:MAG: LptF/LptG family permease, partial [Brevinematia bacterium]
MKFSLKEGLKSLKINVNNKFKKLFINSWIYIPLKKYDLMIYKDLAINYLASFLVISLIVWLKEIYLIYIQYIQKGAQLLTTLSIFFYSLPFTMAITIPSSVVMASLLTFNKMSINLEILTLRASGVRKTRLFLPVLVFSLFISVIGFWFFDTLLIKGNEMYIRSMIKMRVEKPFIDISPGEFPKIGGFEIGFDEISGDEMKGIEIYQRLTNSERIIKAASGKIISTGDTPYYVIKLKEGTFIEKSLKTKEIFSSQFKYSELRIDYEVSQIPSFNVNTQPRMMSRYKLEKIIKQMEKDYLLRLKIEERKNLYKELFNKYIELLKLTPSILTLAIKSNKQIESQKDKIIGEIEEINRKIKEINKNQEVANYNFFVFEQLKKTSIPFSALFYGLIGFVFGIMIKVRTGKGGSLLIGIGVILIQTYLTYVSEIPIRNGDMIPIVGAWIGNITLLIPGLYLLL